MRTVTLLYIITTILYLGIGDSSMYWALINMFNILAYVIVLLNVKFEKDIYTTFATYLTTGRILYTAVCAISTNEWIYATGKVFALTFAVCLIILIIARKIKRSGGLS